MKKLIVLVLIFMKIYSYAQNRTNVWELSPPFSPGDSTCEMKYSNGSMDTSLVDRKMYFFTTNASICDTSGNILFYTNGLTIENGSYDTLENAVNFNPGGATDSYEPVGMGTCQGVLIVPDPANEKRYYIFHESGETFIFNNVFQVQPLHLSYSVVDMNLDGSLGGIVDTLKNKYAIIDTLLWGGLTAVKHANGRDWWIIVHRFYDNKYYKILLTPNGLEEITEQLIGSNIIYDVDVQATFSPDGSKYCISTHGGWFDFMNFDRCSGEFSNSVTIFGPDSLGIWGNSFSPNGRYLYISSFYNLYQFDTWDPNMSQNVIHVAAWDSFVDPIYHIPILFFMHQIAPDGKIYLSTWNGSRYLNVINNPDDYGLNCNFEPHSFFLPKNQYNLSIPSFPNYDLGVLQDSPCDTISSFPTSRNLINKLTVRLLPNPVTDWINIIYQSQDNILLEIYDLEGTKVYATNLFHYFKNRLINVSDLSAGVYIAVIIFQGERIWSEKIVVQH